jgi:hypothetical protein
LLRLRPGVDARDERGHDGLGFIKASPLSIAN